MQLMVEIRGPFLKLRFVSRRAAKARDGEVIAGGGHGRSRKKHESSEPHTKPGAHTKPHLRRSSHSAARSAKRSIKMTGMFHRSLVSRPVIPASEYEISCESCAAFAAV